MNRWVRLWSAFVGMVMIGLIGLLLDGSVRVLQALVTPWRRAHTA